MANQEQLLYLVDEIISKSDEQCNENSFELFVVLHYVLALQQEGMFDDKVS